jgi:hypothetical protein
LPDLEPANYVLIFDFLRYITKRIKVWAGIRAASKWRGPATLFQVRLLLRFLVFKNTFKIIKSQYDNIQMAYISGFFFLTLVKYSVLRLTIKNCTTDGINKIAKRKNNILRILTSTTNESLPGANLIFLYVKNVSYHLYNPIHFLLHT